jgi:hypothetical protein
MGEKPIIEIGEITVPTGPVKKSRSLRGTSVSFENHTSCRKSGRFSRRRLMNPKTRFTSPGIHPDAGCRFSLKRQGAIRQVFKYKVGLDPQTTLHHPAAINPAIVREIPPVKP